MALLLKNANYLNKRIDILVKNGKIYSIEPNGEVSDKTADKVIDCSGLSVIPGICDMHVHLRDPGQTHKEDLISGAMAAAAGGVTSVVCMANTEPVIDTADAVRDIIKRSETLPVRIYPCAAITKGLKGCELTDFAALKAVGAVAVSDDGKCVPDASLMGEAMVKARKAGLTVISHCEDTGYAERLEFSKKDASRISENVITARELSLAENLDVPVHIAHVSASEAVNYIEIAKKRGVKVTCEAAPHHFSLTELELQKRDADYKMNPPLRGVDDVESVTEGLRSGIIDCIASDHAPHSREEKADFDSAPNGVNGLETILAVALTKLYHTGIMPLEKIVELLCVNPRKILGIPGGTLEIGSPADITVVDLNKEWGVNPDKMCSKSANTCFKGMTLKGKVIYTVLKGEVVYEYNA